MISSKVLNFKNSWLIILLLIGSISIGLSLTPALYHQTIAKVSSVKISQRNTVLDEHQNTEKIVSQEINVTILNGKNKYKKFQFLHTYSSSQITQQPIHTSDYLFVNLKDDQITFIDFKRDTALLLLITLFSLLLFFVMQKRAFATLLSLCINGALFASLLFIYKKSPAHLLVPLFLIFVPISIGVSLFITGGRTQKNALTILASILSTYLTFFIGWIVITLFNHQGLRYEEMELITRPPQTLFLASLLLGSLGGVMDIAMTLSSALYEIRRLQPQLTNQELKKSGYAIGKDILGPMTNIMIFSYLSGAIPLMIIFLRNQMSFTYTFSIVLSLEMARALVGSIGIVLTIPITIHLLLFIHQRWGLSYER